MRCFSEVFGLGGRGTLTPNQLLSLSVPQSPCQCPDSTVAETDKLACELWTSVPVTSSLLSSPPHRLRTLSHMQAPYCLYWKAISAISFRRWRYTWSEKP